MAKKKEWKRPDPPARIFHRNCSDCGIPIYVGQAVWRCNESEVCIEHWTPDRKGHVDCAGLQIGDEIAI